MPDPTPKSELFIGVDLGGTKILAGVFDSRLKLIGTYKLSTKPQRGAEGVIERISRCVRDAVDECDLKLDQVKAIGIGAPGAVDTASGTVIFAPNLDWRDVPLAKQLQQELKIPVHLENDCTLSMLGVYDVELEAKPRNVLGIFLGTGIGGGLILDGQVYRGYTRCAGEIGHMVLEINGPKCGCGNRGCFEALASRTAIFQRIRSAVKDGQETLLTDTLGKDLEDLRSGDLRKAIRRGDKFVDHIVEEAAEYTGIAVANLANILGPEVIVLGGGVIEALGSEMMSIIIETAKEYAMPGALKCVEIIATELGDNAGITGGAVLARKSLK
jgi:glucokinase